MTEHEVCIGCPGNAYPNCLFTRNQFGFMDISTLNEQFQCGVKDRATNIEYLPDGSIISVARE